MNEESKNKLWEEYGKSHSPQLREQIIIEYANLVKIVAGRLGMYLGYTVEYDDLVGYGTFGLIDAIDKFDLMKGVKFETYASLRIRGAILDQIRKMDWIPRTLRQKQKKIDQAYQKLELEKGRSGTEEEIAAEIGITTEELVNWQNQTKVTNLISLDEFLEQGAEVRMDTLSNSQFEQPERVMEKEEMKQILLETLQQLTENERKVITLYYYEDLTLKEISHILEVSESRVSQLHTKALQKMRQKLGSNMEMVW
ncbi:MAG: FliA/WhiG family RNA polymerase sigma factor [Lachnospiraceae bacterium]|jgi:RNA polymerase sigma factor for flagellar operon FliA|nr:FliA/WhiG family RNA polymerase sigma factor [Lachnospiraceae bacterium]MBQ5560752.1 FliA/WhiG family RNA polymerase sigma factor [Lachnospiraceae bacterium]MCR4802225.1 FliA/WhiG family RNA polymerase sigma factor [Lachnospiraceae bacterium]